MSRRLTRSILAGITLLSLACARHARSVSVQGEYTRSSVRLIQEGQVLAIPPGQLGADLPSQVQLDNANGFVVASGDAQLTGHYRLERDSIFLDRDEDGGARLAFAGRATGDTLDVHWIPSSGQRSNTGDVELVFVRSK